MPGPTPGVMRTVEAHQRAVTGLITPRAAVRLPLAAAHGLVLTEDVIAPVSLPVFDNSAMDGYAVRAADLAAAEARLAHLESSIAQFIRSVS